MLLSGLADNLAALSKGHGTMSGINQAISVAKTGDKAAIEALETYAKKYNWKNLSHLSDEAKDVLGKLSKGDEAPFQVKTFMWSMNDVAEGVYTKFHSSKFADMLKGFKVKPDAG